MDGFGGTASVSYLFKAMKKKVTFNDLLLSNYHTGVALIENDSTVLGDEDLKFILHENGYKYPSFIQETFKDIYYLSHENKWLDIVTFNIDMLSQNYDEETSKKKKAVAFHILFQACLSKRPFNLFHRRNLHLRLAEIKRSFGNKKSWDTDFNTLFLRFHHEFSQKIFANGLENKAICTDITKLEDICFDLVYLDPPYTRPKEKFPKDYHSLYHFLEGLADYDNWQEKIDWKTNNRCMVNRDNGWNKKPPEGNFDNLFKKFQDSTIVVSYGEPGNPPIKKIEELLFQYKSKVTTVDTEYKYKLNHKNGDKMREVLIVAN